MTEQQPYEVLESFRGFELRRYPAHRVARVTVHADFESAGRSAFGYLFDYLSGANTLPAPYSEADPGGEADFFGVTPAGSSSSSPPEAGAGGTRIPMTAPVLVQPGALESTVTVGFILPESLGAGEVPEPTDPAVMIDAVPEARGAAAFFSGRWTSPNFSAKAADLEALTLASGLTPLGPARFALFDPPYKPWFLRRNEVILTVE